MSRSKDFRRAKPSRKPKSRVLIVCEGKKTERLYLDELNRHYGSKILLVFSDTHSAPKSIVETAVARKKQAAKMAQQDPNESLEAVWCVFDRDEHPLVPEALDQARANNIPVAFSDPCFELWLLLHFQDQTAHLDRHAASRNCKNHMPGYMKSPDMPGLLARLPNAEERADALCQRQIKNKQERQNPWTEVHQLIAALRKLGM